MSLFEGCLTVHLHHEIKWNANLMQQCIYWSFLSSTCFGRISPSSGALDVKVAGFCTLNRPHPLPAFLLVSPDPSPAYSRINITAPESPTTLHTSAYEDGTDRRFRNVGIYKPDAGELPYRKFTIFSTRRKFKIKKPSYAQHVLLTHIRSVCVADGTHQTPRGHHWHLNICPTVSLSLYPAVEEISV